MLDKENEGNLLGVPGDRQRDGRYSQEPNCGENDPLAKLAIKRLRNNEPYQGGGGRSKERRGRCGETRHHQRNGGSKKSGPYPEADTAISCIGRFGKKGGRKKKF